MCVHMCHITTTLQYFNDCWIKDKLVSAINVVGLRIRANLTDVDVLIYDWWLSFAKYITFWKWPWEGFIILRQNLDTSQILYFQLLQRLFFLWRNVFVPKQSQDNIQDTAKKYPSKGPSYTKSLDTDRSAICPRVLRVAPLSRAARVALLLQWWPWYLSWSATQPVQSTILYVNLFSKNVVRLTGDEFGQCNWKKRI